MDLGSLINSGGQAIQDLFGSEGATAEANSYNTAAQLAQQNAALTAASTRIQETQTARSVLQTEGTQITDVAGAGFTESGSALDLLRSSAQQGALQESLTNIQGAINENAYAAQAGAYKGAAAAANENASANTVGAISAIGGALISNGSSLVSAGKTVVSGIGDVYDSIFGSGTGTAANYIGATPTAQVTEDINEAVASGEGSVVDQAISGGSSLSESIASSDIGVDTSGIGIGTDLADVDTGIGDFVGDVSDSVASSISDLSDLVDFGEDAIPGIGEIAGASQLLDMIPGFSSIPVLGDITQGITDTVGAVTSAVGGAIGDVGDAIGDVGSAIGGALGSVICTGYYKQGFIRHRIWVGCQYYGAVCDPVIFRGYHLWGKPIADKIVRHRWLAFLLFPIFRGTIYQMAAEMGIGKSTRFGRCSLTLFRAVSKAVGLYFITKERKEYAVKA